MSNTTIAKSIKVVTYLQEQNSRLIENTGTIYISTKNINTLANLLILAQHQSAVIKTVKEYINNLKEALQVAEDEQIHVGVIEEIIKDLDYYLTKHELQIKKLSD